MSDSSNGNLIAVSNLFFPFGLFILYWKRSKDLAKDDAYHTTLRQALGMI